MNGRARDIGVEIPYPVLEERMLPPVPRRFMRSARRDLTDLPVLRPGSVLVFYNGSRYVAFGESIHLTGTEDIIVDATAVALVDIRPRHFTVHFQIPSDNLANDFTVRVDFRARVADSERAAETGSVAMTRFLISYLGRDPLLSKLGSEFPINEVTTVRDLVVSRIESYCEYNPINLPGLAVELDSAGVQVPRELRQHVRDMRDERWHQEIHELRTDAEDTSIERHKTWVNEGPNTLTAVGLSRDQVSVSDAIQNARNDEARVQAQFAEAFRILQENGAMDYLDIDPTEMVKTYLEKLTGQPIQRTQKHGLHSADNSNREALGPGDDGEDDEQPDEAELDE